MKYLSIIKYALLLLSAALVLVGIFTFPSGGKEATGELNLMLAWSTILFGVTVLLSLAMPIVGLAQNPKSAIRALIGLGLLAVVFLVSYAMADDTPIRAAAKILDNSTELIFGDIALYSIYIMFGVVILSLVGTEVYKAVKN